MVLLYELKLAHANCEFELQTLRHRYDALAPGKLPSTSVLQGKMLVVVIIQPEELRHFETQVLVTGPAGVW